MKEKTEYSIQADKDFNQGDIKKINGRDFWVTHLGIHELRLPIVPVANLEHGQLCIASFVVMKQDQVALGFAGGLIANSVARVLPEGRKILLVTVETKGAFFVRIVWDELHDKMGDNLSQRVVVLRKGEPKVYMGDRFVRASYRSITSASVQTMILDEDDRDLLVETTRQGVKPVIIDDFMGNGGTAVAICKIFDQIGVSRPDIMGVIGSDGNLYKQTFAENNVDIRLVPQPFLLRLPTFVSSH